MFGLIDCILVVVCYFVLYIGIYCMSLHNKIMPYLMLHLIMYMVCCWKSAIMYLFPFYSLLDYFVICFLFVPCYIYTLFCSFASLLGWCHSSHCHAIKHWRFTLALIVTYTNVSNFYQISSTLFSCRNISLYSCTSSNMHKCRQRFKNIHTHAALFNIIQNCHKTDIVQC